MLGARKSVLQASGASVGQAQMEVVVEAHERFIRRNGGARLIQRFVSAPRLDLSRRLLSEADFTGAMLEGSAIWGANLEKACFYCADLRGCDLRGANLRWADIRGASLAGSTLVGAILDGADMRAAQLLRPDENGVIRLSAQGPGNYAGAGVDFSNCAMRGVKLRDAKLEGANFSGAVLEGADLAGAQLKNAVFHGAVLTSVCLDGLDLGADQLEGCVLDPSPEAQSRAAQLKALVEEAAEWAATGGRKGRPASMDREDLRPLGDLLRGRPLAALSARGACAVGVDFSGAQLQAARLDGADLRGANFNGADLRGASFRNARLSHARFKDADLSDLPLAGGRALPPCFEGASLDGVSFPAAAVVKA